MVIALILIGFILLLPLGIWCGICGYKEEQRRHQELVDAVKGKE